MTVTSTEIIAHRGASRDRRENTLAAFALALEQEADGIELDVHATADGTVVVHHDAALGADATLPKAELAELTARTLAAVRLGSGDPVPTLDEVLDLVGRRATVYVEVKGHGIERAVADCLRRHPDARLAVHAFDHRIPPAVRRELAGTRIGLLSASYPLDVGALLTSARADDFWQHAPLIDADLVQAVRRAGARIVAWTENDPAHARALVDMGVDALCTDTPGVLRAALAAGPPGGLRA
jgi:glycerophosphoryl diester phosphodiesterase